MAGTQSFPVGGGEMGARVRAHDWAATPLGPIEGWPPELRAATSLCLHSAFPTMLYWGADSRAIYNDAFIELLGKRHPQLGEPGPRVWPKLWPTLVPLFARIVETREGASMTDRQMMIVRDGERVESWWNSSFTPVVDESGAVRGILSQPREITHFVLQRRFDKLMLALDEKLRAADTTAAKMDAALALIGEHLGVKRTGYGEVDVAAGTLHIARCWTSAGMPDISGHYPLGAFGKDVSAELRQGKSVRIGDNRNNPLTRDPATRATYEAIGLRAGIVVPIIDNGRYVGGMFAQDDQVRVWTNDQVALAEAAAARLWQALVRSRAETAQRDSEERYRLIFEQADDIVFATDLDQKVIECNPATERAVGLSRDRIVGRSIAEFITPEQFGVSSERLRERVARGGTARNEVEVIAGDGRVLRWEVASSMFANRDGTPIGVHTVARDVTERRLFDERRELLIHELNHRVKNTLSLVQGLAMQSFRDQPAAAADFIARLGALAAAHDLLTRDQWEGATLGALIGRATAALGGDSGRIAISGPLLTVAPKAAVALVMALHELATNAVKYGALSVEGGCVAIGWEATATGFCLTWRERGGPPVAKPTRHGFGVRMIERALASDLGGTVSIDFAPAGLICTIDAPFGAAHPGIAA